MSQQYVRAVAAGAIALLAGCGSSAGPRSTAEHTVTSTPSATTSTARTATAPATRTAASAPATRAAATRHHRHHHRQRPPGTLPQTHQLPSSDTRQFKAQIAALWRGIRAGAQRPALPAFFPEAAYAQVKAIADPDADYEGRLVAEYALDIAAAHALLGAGARTARLRAVNVPTAYAHWVPPGTCYNRIGYYEVPNARLVYEIGGQLHSFGIASMISWRGAWYVVHLGAVTRSDSGGVVDEPSAGAGTSAPSSTC